MNAAWILGYVVENVSEEQLCIILTMGIVNSFIGLLRTTHRDLLDQAVSVLGYFANHTHSLRNFLIKENAIKSLLCLVQRKTTVRISWPTN